MKTVWKLGRAVATTVVWAFGIACVALLLAVGLGPRTGRYRILTVLTGSMQPGIPVGAVVVVTPERPSQLRVGQIVTYRIPVEDHRVITHRVVQVLEGGDHPVFQTQGDANNAPDYWLAQVSGDTVWHVRTVVPGLGLTLNRLRQPAAHRVAVLVAPTAFALLVVADTWRRDPAPPVAPPS
jgi:signal peptidase